MARSLLVAAILALAAGPCGAQAVPVRSGEHETFSRLVFADAPGRGWTIARPAADRIAIAFSAGLPDLDVERIFDFIPRRRLLDATVADRVMTLTLGCACAVSVSQIATGHIVVDVRDGPPLPAPTVPPLAGPVRPMAMILPIVLPLRDIPFAPPRPKAAVHAAPDLPVAIVGPPQVRRHPSGPQPLIPAPAGTPLEEPALVNCEVEPIARDALLADPTAARAALDGRAATLLDGEDRLDLASVQSLARTYLAAGWGAEAAQIAALDPADDGLVAVVAAALDEEPPPEGARIDPGCGPATTVLALLVPDGTDRWERADTTDLVRFVDRLHPVTVAQLAPRLTARLTRLGAGDLLDGLAPAGSHGADSAAAPGPVDAVAAGTNEAAVRATVALLAGTNADGSPASEPYLVNAIALLPSLPDGDLRRALEAALSAALVLSNRPSEAVAMVAAGGADAAELLTLAFDRLPDTATAELAVRLRPYLAPNDPVAQRAAAAFAGLGLDATASSFAIAPADVGPTAAPPDGLTADPWLARDLAAMTGADPADWTVRNRIAAEILSRNAATVPGTDLAAAGAVLEGSRRISDLAAELLDAAAGG